MTKGISRKQKNWPLKHRILPYLIILPALLLTIGILYPFILAVYYSLTDYRLISPDINFIGLGNYFDLIKDINFWKSFGLTLFYAALVIMVEIPLGLGVATLLNHEMKGIKIFRFISIIPLMMPPVVAALMWKIIMAENGILNYFLTLIGATKIAWLANTYSILSIVLIDVWINTPFCAVILLAGLQSLPREPFESSQVDGASVFFNFRRLTLPMLKPFILLTILFRSIDSLKMFDVIYATTKGAHSTMLLQINAYYESFRWYNMGGALAYMMVLWIIIFIISRVLVKWWSRAMQKASGKLES
jgi:multiple sugar transport system permease protein